MYEYRCGECDAEYEELVSLHTDDSTVACPSCQAHASTRKLSVFAVSVSSPGFDCPAPSMGEMRSGPMGGAPMGAPCGAGTCGRADCGPQDWN